MENKHEAVVMKLKVVIMAGGKGTRISSINESVPKPLIDICGKPLLERQIDWLKKEGVKEVTLVVGHLGNIICKYFGNGKSFGISIKYVVEEDPLGTAGALFYFRKSNKPILLINGDIMVDLDLKKLIKYHRDKNSDITLVTHPNNHPYDSALIETNDDSRIIGWLNKEDSRCDYKNRVNAGIHIIEPKTLRIMGDMDRPKKMDLDREFLKPNICNFKIFAYDTPEYIKDMGTPSRYKAVCDDYDMNLIAIKNLENNQKAIFLDRDGTINKHKEFITKPDQIELIEGSAEAIKKINEAGYLAVLITNQPVLARGECSIEQLGDIHKRLERLLGENGAYLDDILFCPHHPDKGFDGERLEYKIECTCRKPKPGLIYEAAKKYNIDLAKSFMIGDSFTDLVAGESAGCKTGFIYSTYKKESELIKADFKGENLKEIIDKILVKFKGE